MALGDNTFEVYRALVGARAIRRAASNFVQIARAMENAILNPRLSGTWSLGSRLAAASGTVAGSEQMIPAIPNSDRPNSSVENEPTKPEKTRLRHNSSKSSRSDSSSPNFKALLDIFSSVYHSLAISPSRSRQAHQGNSVHRDKIETDLLADFKRSAARLGGQLAAPFAAVLKRALVRATQIVNEPTEFLRLNTRASKITNWVLRGFVALFGLGTISKLLRGTVIEPLREGLRLVLSPVFALRWQASSVADFGAMLAAVRLASYLVRGGITAAIAALAVGGYELYRHWNAAKRMMSRWIESLHRTVARLVKWTADKIRSASAYAYAANSIATITVETRNALHLPTTAAPTARAATTARGMNRALAVEHAAIGGRPAPVLRAVRRAAAAASFAAPLMLAGAPAGASAAPLIPTSDTARIAAPLPAVRSAQSSIVINYAPNVIIHSESGADTAALKRRVMEVLERHGRELHQVLTREIVRQQRRDF
jgi:hypothetical protein